MRSKNRFEAFSVRGTREPFFVRTSGAFRSACAWRSESQLPTRAMRRDALDSGDPERQLRREQAVVGRLDRQFANGRDPHLNRDRPEPAGVERDSPRHHGRFRDSGRPQFEHQSFQSAPLCGPVGHHQFVHEL